MDAERWDKVKAILDQVLDLDGADRNNFLNKACAGDSALLREVKTFLGTMEGEEDILGQAAFVKTPEAGDVFGNYRLEKALGEGGMGMVFQAVRADDSFDASVAIKVMRAGMQSAAMQERFLAERQILANLSHPNIARLYDGGISDDGHNYIVMEYVDGVPIDVYCRKHKANIKQRLQLLRKVCAAVAYAHANLVVHRDLKPANILVDAQGEPKLLDFGIAKMLSADGNMATRTQLQAMTPEYAAPEQLRGESVGTATDVYALGMVAYELLAGRRPYYFDRENTEAIYKAVCEYDPKRPGSIRSHATSGIFGEVDLPTFETPDTLPGTITQDLDIIILKALRKEPGRRYASVQQMEEDLERYEQGFPIKARKDTLTYRTSKFVRRHKFAVSSACILAVLLLCSLVLFWVQRNHALQAQQIAEHEAAVSSRTAEFLKGLFTDARPEAGKGKILTAQDILDRGADKLLENMEEDTTVKLELATTVANAYGQLGHYEASNSFLRQIREYSEPESEQWARLTADMGKGLVHMRRQKEAINTLREAIEVLSRYTTTDLDLIDARRNLGKMLRFGKNKAYREEAFELAAANLEALEMSGDESSQLALCMDEMAGAYRGLGEAYAAEALYRESLALRRRLHDGPYTTTAQALNNLGMLLAENKRFQEARVIFEEAYAMRRFMHPQGHPTISIVSNNLGVLNKDMGKYEQARFYYEQSRNNTCAIKGDGNPNYIYATLLLAKSYALQKNYTQAIPYAEEGIGLILDHKTPFPAAPNLMVLSDYYFELGDKQRAKQRLQLALKHAKKPAMIEKIKQRLNTL